MPAPNQIPKSILNNGIKSSDLQLLNDWGKYFAEKDLSHPFKTAITSTQIRKFFGEIKRIQADFKNVKQDVILLDPKIAYAVGRAKKEKKQTKLEDFYKQLSPLLLDIDEDEKKFKNFVNIVEAIVAYHKASGGL